MADSTDRSLRQTLLGSALAGGVAIVALTALSAADLGPELLQFGIALVLGIGAAQLYEASRE